VLEYKVPQLWWEEDLAFGLDASLVCGEKVVHLADGQRGAVKKQEWFLAHQLVPNVAVQKRSHGGRPGFLDSGQHNAGTVGTNIKETRTMWKREAT
jgi:hypothetical protein